MRKSIGVGIVLGLCLGLSSQAIRGDPIVPDCAYCDCAVSKAWRFTNMAGFRVLTTQPSGNTAGYGDPVSTARWAQPIDLGVYSGICLRDYHEVADNRH